MNGVDDFYALRGKEQLYAVLELDSTATKHEIRKAYRRLAVLYHPDKNPTGEEMFKKITFAHRILSDDEQRTHYDTGELRNHLRKVYDPNMDPNVELEPDQLRAFINRLVQEEQRMQNQWSNFEEKRRLELKRRETFEQEHPGFKPTHPLSSERKLKLDIGQWPTCAELHQKYISKEESTNPKKSVMNTDNLTSNSVRESNSMNTSRITGKGRMGWDYREAMLRHFRAEGGLMKKYVNNNMESVTREQNCRSSSCTSKPLCRFTEKSVGTESSSTTKAETKLKLPFLQPRVGYDENTEHIRILGSNFDYKSYVERERQDRDILTVAILADALRDYDPLN